PLLWGCVGRSGTARGRRHGNRRVYDREQPAANGHAKKTGCSHPKVFNTSRPGCIPQDGSEPGAGTPPPKGLLDLDRRPGRLELLASLAGPLLWNMLEDRLRSAVDEVLRLLQPEIREGADFLDDLDLLVAGALEDDVELR